MLIDYIVDYCNKTYRKNSCDDCNHPTGCKGDCKECLDEIHWLRRDGRQDYNCERLLNYYTCRYSFKYCSEISYALNEIDLGNYPRYDILSLGCGAAPGLMAFDYINQMAKKPIRYRGYDRNTLWEPIHDEVESYTMSKCSDVDAKLRLKDVFYVLLKNKSRSNYNVIIIQYLISHLYNTKQIYAIDKLLDGLIDNVLKYKRNDSPLLIIINDIDSNNKGRDCFWPFCNKVMNAGYQVNAIAKCFKPELHLKDATQYPYPHNKFSIPDDIKDYYKCAIECTSAQLIIEVR